MRAITKIVAASFATLSLSLAATAASATTLVSIATSGDPGADQISWTSTGPGSGDLLVDDLATYINFNNALVNDGAGQEAFLTLTATANGSLSTTPGPNFTQTGLDGEFTFWNAAHDTKLLHGVFTGLWLTGLPGGETGNITDQLGQVILDSDIVDLSYLTHFNASFTFSNVHPIFSLGQNGDELQSFDADSLAGTFGGSVPEPGTWALMILGFGGAGAMLRSRRQLSVTAA
ncbi:MAG: PEP-CTERM sorting domain-containing protein [Phenylobacterium sp.]|uniref:PEPxxWA-CTERM sorting domain-containing protein n=1 Tax=Phenylobacterium sp. TaxID=1871053 RepID=UPI0025DAA2A1|nr:PEPxxWA-CTERM sorting domain-containing protein [Phenylobacterium sp.]MBI1198434.1 PEP-CTERM sorting domain-containing protein [Phenylobacterium sp.]